MSMKVPTKARMCVCPSPAWPGTAHLYALLLPWRCPPCQANAIWLLWKHPPFFGLCLWARCISQLVMTGGWWEWVWHSTRVLIKPEIQRLQEKITQICGCPPLQRTRFGNICSCLHGFVAFCLMPRPRDLKLRRPWQTHTNVAVREVSSVVQYIQQHLYGGSRWEFTVWGHVVGLSLLFCSSDKNNNEKRWKRSPHRGNTTYLNVHCFMFMKKNLKAGLECYHWEN